MRLTLMPLTARDLHELLDAPDAFALRHALTLEPGACAPRFVYERALANMQAAPGWAQVLSTRLYVVDGERVVGSGGVKAPPLADGEVEIGYGVAPAWQGQGLATQAARGLTDEALAHGASRVSAFTTPENTASWRLLQRIGFRRDGDTIDPDDGLVWRWVHDKAT
jgi:RimJ/RimL family protein N-acetyltransferase